MAKARTEVEIEVEVELSDEQRIEYGTKLALKMKAYKDLEELAKEKKKQIKLMLDNSASEIETLREAVETGKAKQVETAEEEPDFKKGIVKVYTKKGKFLHDRKMSDDERQTHMAGLGPDTLGNKPDGNPPAKSPTRAGDFDLKD